MQNNKNNILEFSEEDIDSFELLLRSSNLCLKNITSASKTVQEMNCVCSEYLKYNDSDLLGFKGIWSQIDDIKDNIQDKKAQQEEIEKYLDEITPSMKEMCKSIISKYTPVLADLKLQAAPNPLSVQEWFSVMRSLVDMYLASSNSVDIDALSGCMMLNNENNTVDSDIWHDWVRILSIGKNEKCYIDKAFEAAKTFLNEYADRTLSKDIKELASKLNYKMWIKALHNTNTNGGT